LSTRAGQLLVASGKLQDPNFARAVVLIVQDDDNGAMGLVLNRPLETTVREACEQVMADSECVVESPLHQGGPCESLLTVLHNRPSHGEVEVIDGVYFTAEKEKIIELMTGENQFSLVQDADGETRAKFFAGYSGWGAGQLDAEIGAGAWLLAKPDVKHIFDGEDQLWTRLMTELTLGKWVDPKRIPDDPSVN
jgi:putative transcriptional regulator